MADPLNIATTVQQLPNVQQLAHADLTKAEVFQNMLNPMVAKEQQKEDTKVQHVDKKDKLSAANREGGGQQRPDHPGQQRDKKPPGEEEETDKSSSSPWSGHLIDLKI